MNHKSSLLSLIKRLALVFALVHCSYGLFTQAATFKFRLMAEPQSFDWHIASTSIETPILMNIMEGLTEVDENLKPKACLAEKYSISTDQKTYTFQIRKGVKWSDGVVLKAQDFVEGWKRLLSPATAAPYAYLLYDVVGAEEFNKGTEKDFSKVGIIAKDDQTLVVTLKKPVAYFLYLTGFWPLFPVRQDLIDSLKTQWARPGKLVTVGAYTVKEYRPQSKIILGVNPHYWRARKNVTEVVAQVVKDSATALNIFKSGGLQMMQDFSPDDLKQAKAMVEFRTYPYLKTHYIAFRVKNSIAQNADLRRAISYAIDRKPIPKILNGTQKVATSFIPPKVVGYDSKMGVQLDVDKAKSFLKKSGFDIKTPIEIVARNSERPRILTQYIQSELKKNLGLNVQIQLFDHKVFRSQISTENYPMMMMVWSADYPDGDTFMGLFESKTGNNMTRVENAKVDSNIQAARLEWNTLKREKLYREAQQILQVQDADILPLYYEENEALVAKNVKGFQINPIGYFYIRNIEINEK